MRKKNRAKFLLSWKLWRSFCTRDFKVLFCHPLPSQTLEQLNHSTKSLLIALLRKQHLAAHLVCTCGTAHARQRKKRGVLGRDCNKTAPVLGNGSAGNSSTQVLLLQTELLSVGLCLLCNYISATCQSSETFKHSFQTFGPLNRL